MTANLATRESSFGRVVYYSRARKLTLGRSRKKTRAREESSARACG